MSETDGSQAGTEPVPCKISPDPGLRAVPDRMIAFGNQAERLLKERSSERIVLLGPGDPGSYVKAVERTPGAISRRSFG